MNAEQLAAWAATGTVLIAFLVALRMQVIEPLIRALRENTTATNMSAANLVTTATAVAANTASRPMVAPKPRRVAKSSA